MLRYNDWQIPEGREAVNFYTPDLQDEDSEQIKNAGHGGGDFLVIKAFFDSIRTGKPHQFDVYFATALSSVAILSHRSITEGSRPFDVPDFRKKEDRDAYREDTLSPFWLSDGTPPSYPCCSNPDYLPSEWQLENYR